uniref:uncharacterized protein LOC114589657 n=1 Tax=Podarcis muralis TaxID=64176 RepID=UPI00109FAC54|nr:uncharacterized protein LOC114589657 [Podarcis muralis]
MDAVTYSFHRDVVNMLPGGMAISRGPSYEKQLPPTTKLSVWIPRILQQVFTHFPHSPPREAAATYYKTFCLDTTNTESSTMPEIVPKNKAPGVDFCGVDEYYYIVRSDLGCYMRSTNFHEGKDLEVFSLHSSCQGGDHYLAHEDDLFYIIKGDNYRRVSNMNADLGSVVYSLHPNCRGGDHYLSAFGSFYIIFQKRGVYRRVSNMHDDTDAIEYTLHPLADGLYSGASELLLLCKPHDEWGVITIDARSPRKFVLLTTLPRDVVTSPEDGYARPSYGSGSYQAFK